jgi:hypothetical protein
LRLSRPARTSPGELLLCHRRDRFTEIPAATAWSQRWRVDDIRAEAARAGGAGGPDGGSGVAQRIRGLPGPGLGCRVDGVGVVEVPVQVGEALLHAGQPPASQLR